MLPGIHNALLAECQARFGVGCARREGFGRLLDEVIAAARNYPTIKRVLVWGSFVSAKPEPNDLDYSLVVSVTHGDATVQPEHRRFLVARDARTFYGTDRGYFEIRDYPVEPFAERLLFIAASRTGTPRGIVEIVTYTGGES